jgi:riboflavin-specific deaminase-like protein
MLTHEVSDEAREVAALLDLLAPLCVGRGSERLVVGHLAQSLDGRIATRTGASQFISGEQDLVHTHRLRALCDAVVVGAETVLHDDPRLTTRLVPGPNPTRVILDPQRRLGPDRRVFCDGAAPTLVVCRADHAKLAASHGQAELVPVATDGEVLAPAAVLAALRQRGLARVFVEGGGVTISRFLAAGAFHRLHLAVAPVILGSGRSSFTLAPIDELTAALTFDTHQVPCGRDILLDCVPRTDG